jgi:hypothetical protein
MQRDTIQEVLVSQNHRNEFYNFLSLDRKRRFNWMGWPGNSCSFKKVKATIENWITIAVVNLRWTYTKGS